MLYLTSVSQPAWHRVRFDTGNDPHSGEGCDDGGASRADERERQPHDGKNVDAHAHIKNDLYREHSGNSNDGIR